MPAARMIGHHLSISALWNVPERLRRQLLARWDLLAEIDQALAHGRIAQPIDRGGVEPGDDVLRRTLGRPVINLKTAKALGLIVPPMLIARADGVID